MPHYRIHLINAEFASCEERDYETLDAARNIAIASAVRVVSESISRGKPIASVEIRIEDGDRVVAHHIVNLNVSELLSEGRAAE